MVYKRKIFIEQYPIDLTWRLDGESCEHAIKDFIREYRDVRTRARQKFGKENIVDMMFEADWDYSDTPDWYIVVKHKETEAAFKKRVAKLKKKAEERAAVKKAKEEEEAKKQAERAAEAEKQRYETYLKLKEEFENE